MTRTFELAFPKEIFLAAVERLAPQRAGKPGVTALIPYLEQYRTDAYTEDFLSLTTEDAASLALDLWEFNLAHQDNPARVVRVRHATGQGGKPLRFDVAEIVGPDMAFLVDSAIGACQEAKVEVRAVLHPILPGPNGKRSLIQIHVPALDDAHRAEFQRILEETFADVAAVNADHATMKAKMAQAAEGLAGLKATPERSADDIKEARDFLGWLAQDHFTFLGARDYTYARGRRGELAAEEPIVDAASGLGILRNPERNVLARGAEPTVLSPAVRAFLNEPTPLIVAKASFLSRVHRRSHADYVGVKRFDAKGEVVGETRFVGLYTSSAYTKGAADVPLIRRKLAHVKERFATESRFAQRRLDAVLQTYPRDELFQISEDDLARIAKGVLQLQIRPRTQLFIRRDRFDRYVSALLFVPRDSYNSELRTRAHKILADAYGGRTSAYYPSFGEGPLARVHLIVGVSPGHPEPDEDSLDLQMRQLFETWEDALGRTARSHNADLKPVNEARYTAAYKEMFAPEEGLADLGAISSMALDKQLKARAWGADFNANAQHLKVYHRDGPLDLSEIVPVLERMGLRAKAEANFPIRFVPRDGAPERIVYVHDLSLERPSGQRPLEKKFEDTFEAVFARLTENDGFNALVVALGVDWRQAALLRTLCRYRSQSGLDPSELVQVAALRDYPEIASTILKLFAIKFDPGMPGDIASRKLAAQPVIQKLEQLLEGVATLDADRVLRRLVHLVRAAQRTNFYLAEPGTAPDRHIAVKIASQEADPLPAPRPFREIFVWSPDVEGVHLRFGPVARGGLRWSDRRDDFRTEVLGLVKAQQVKNAVIVPVGSKGGFFPKLLTPKATREEAQAIGIAAYKVFVGSLLQLTDNVVKGKTVRPDRLIAWDGDDPYLVVAADKGTAAFSDIANGISAEWKFWLGDAFASGGSVGYDHKKMGITARGAWEAVKRHFRELGTDIQSQPFRVIGIGDMSGDVFGNGMLLSKCTRLVAAFDHRHIFLDPTPDAATSFAERERMFALPRSSWADYNAKLISQGGGIYPRTAKSIPLSAEVRVMTGLADDAVTPDQLIKALLSAETDLLWFGGIGTYVKASTQSHADVGDKASDGLRVDARDLKARVIGEGANLGMTQAARIEFARRGGRLNTDAIDNSAGVDSSDHEVNIKILLNEAIQGRALKAEDRNALLASMTDDVATHVLRNNYDQTGALSVMEATAAADIDSHERFIEGLESRGKLDRAVEGLPSPEQFRAMRERNQGLTRPELAVIMAYAKLDLFDSLIHSKGPDDPTFESLLIDYFPDELKRFDDARSKHRLRREIIATRLSNRIVNMCGPGFAAQKRDAEGIEAGRLARAVEAAYAVFHFDELFARINALDGKAPAQAQSMMAAETSANLRMLASAFASEQNLMEGNTAGAIVQRYRGKVGEIRAILPQALSPLVLQRVAVRAERYRIAGAPEDLARDVAMVRALASARETVDIAERVRWPLAAVAYVQHETGKQLGLDRMRSAARDLEPRDHWDRLALARVADDLPRQQSELAAQAILQAQKDGVPPTLVDKEVAGRIVAQWIEPRQALAHRLTEPMGSFDRQGVWSLAKLVLLGDAVREFVYASRAEPPKAVRRQQA
jgi:glutamate dehydrogenase